MSIQNSSKTVSVDFTKALASMTSAPVVQLLNQCLADHYTLSAVALAAHWNIVSPTFGELHELFGAVYETADAHTDDLAERIRQIGSFVQVDLAAFQKSAGMTIPSAPQDCDTWISAVVAGIDKSSANLQTFVAATDKMELLMHQDLALAMLQTLSKHRWMLVSSMKG
jgi:starvation-inducible DNA-binding protein